MPAKKMKVEVLDDDGNRYTISFEGVVTRAKAERLLDIVELLGGTHAGEEKFSDIMKATKFRKLMVLVNTKFISSWFSSKEALEEYEHQFAEQISLSTISTYLGRMNERGLLAKRRLAGKTTYCAVTGLTRNVFENSKRLFTKL